MLKAEGGAPQRAVELGRSPFEQRERCGKVGASGLVLLSAPPPPPPRAQHKASVRSAGRPVGPRRLREQPDKRGGAGPAASAASFPPPASGRHSCSVKETESQG